MKNNVTRETGPVIIGEVLYDRFPGGVEVLGGAPFNVAWHLQGFGAAPLFISRVGEDEPGRRVRQAMASWGMNLSGLEIDQTRPTGAVNIRFSGEDHTFDILSNQAYDHISKQQLSQARKGPRAMLYQGTLIMRTQHMRRLLTRLHQQTEIRLFADLNLREPWWRPEDLRQLLQKATWVKVNENELKIIANELSCAHEDLESVARSVQRIVGAELLIITLGRKGAIAFPSRGRSVSVVPEGTQNIVDTVGAGDAFAAVSILGLLQEWPLEITMKRAQAFASQIVNQRGATFCDREVYDQMSRNWGFSSL